jgi:hypothetical protein
MWHRAVLYVGYKDFEEDFAAIFRVEDEAQQL